MSVAVAVNDVLLVRAWTQLVDQAAVNSYAFECITLSGGGITDQDLADDLNTPMAAFYKSLCGNQVEYRGLQVYFIRRALAGLPNPVKNVASAGPCAGGVNTLPRNAAAILKYNTVFRGPTGRGRVFLPFIGSGYSDIHGQPSTGMDVLVNSFASNLLSPRVITIGPNSATFVWGIASRLTTPITFHQMDFAESADKFGQMHKRGDYGKPNVSPI